MSDKYPSLSPYVYCINNPVILHDPNGEDWYENENGTGFWQEGNAATIERDGVKYKNVGENITIQYGTNSVTYHQNEPVLLTENVLSSGDFESQMKDDGSGKKSMPEGNCFVQAGKMVEKSGATSQESPKYDINDSKEGMDYLNSQINKGFSARAHVDRNGDGIGDHWVAISSRTTDLKTKKVISFGFYDPGTRRKDKGTNNTFSVNNNSMVGRPSYSPSLKYIVVGVRKNK